MGKESERGARPFIMVPDINEERTFVMVKPDGVARGLVGEIVGRLERRGLSLRGMKLIRIDRELAERHYGVHRDKAFFASLIEYITSGPVVAMVWAGQNAVAAARATMGVTDPLQASPGSIRGDFGLDIEKNLVHGSDSEETAVKEVGLFFNEDELVP